MSVCILNLSLSGFPSGDKSKGAGECGQDQHDFSHHCGHYYLQRDEEPWNYSGRYIEEVRWSNSWGGFSGWLVYVFNSYVLIPSEL